MIKTLAPPLSALLLGTFGFAAQAQTLQQNHADTIDLGSTRGTAYYVEEPHGYHLIATLVSGRNDPMRFDAVLADGQSAVVSIPASVGAPAHAVTFVRSANHLEVRQSPDLSNVPTQ